MISRDGAGNAWLPGSAEQIKPDAEGTTGTPGMAETAGAEVVPQPPPVTLPVDLPTLLRNLEDAYIKAALARTQSNKKEAAKLLGMGRTTLVEKLRRRNLAASRSSS